MRTRFPCRMVVDLPNWVGDLVMALPATHRLVESNVGGETTIHSRTTLARLCRTAFPTTRVVASRAKADPFGSALRVCRKGGRFDLGVTFRHAWRAKILLKLAARYTLASTGGGARLMIDHRCAVDRGRHQVFDGEPVLLALGADPVDPRWRPELPESVVGEGRRELGPGDRPIVGLAPGGAWGLSKRWPPARFGAVAEVLHTNGIQPVVVVGPDERVLAGEVRAAVGIDLPIVGPRLDVAGLAGMLVHLSALVGNDSGPAHLAAMVGVPVVALFGPTDPGRTAPYGDDHVVVRRRLDCAPCYEPRCPLKHGACMTELRVETVLDAVSRILEDRITP